MLWAAWLINEKVKKTVREWFSIHFKHSFHKSLSWFLSCFYLTKTSVVPLSSVCNTWNYLLPATPTMLSCSPFGTLHEDRSPLSYSTVCVQPQEQSLIYFTFWKFLLKECISFILSDKNLLQDNLTKKKNHEYEDYSFSRAKLRELQTIHSNVNTILGKEQTQEKEKLEL